MTLMYKLDPGIVTMYQSVVSQSWLWNVREHEQDRRTHRHDQMHYQCHSHGWYLNAVS